MLEVVTIVGNPKAASRTRTAAEHVADALATAVVGESRSTVIELAEVADSLFDWAATAVDALVDRVVAADIIVVASPTYKATYTGLLKAFLDRVPAPALLGTIAVPVMVGAGAAHALAVETHLRPVLVELGALVPTPGLYLLEEDLPLEAGRLESWLRAVLPVVRAVTGATNQPG